MESRIRTVLRDVGRLAVNVDTIGLNDDLYSAGLSSLATVNVMLSIEETFNIEFPDRLLTRRSFQSISTLMQVIEGLKSSALT